MDVLDWIEKAKQFNSNELLNSFGLRVSSDESIVDIQREQWSNKGTDHKGQIIGIYSQSTEEMTNGLKKYGTPWNLRNTGDFWENLFLSTSIKGKELEFVYDSNGINKSKLFDTIKKHGLISNPTNIFGVENSYIERFIKKIEPKFVEQLNNYYDV